MYLGPVLYVGIRKIGLVPFLPVKVHFPDVEVILGPVLGSDPDGLPVVEGQLHPWNGRRAYIVHIARRGCRIEPHGIEQIPGRHLSAVIIPAEGPRLVPVEMVRDIPYPFLALPWLPEIIV